MTLQQLKNRQQTLTKLIGNVGGKNNIRKWVDELIVIEAKIEKIESQNKTKVKAKKRYTFKEAQAIAKENNFYINPVFWGGEATKPLCYWLHVGVNVQGKRLKVAYQRLEQVVKYVTTATKEQIEKDM